MPIIKGHFFWASQTASRSGAAQAQKKSRPGGGLIFSAKLSSRVLLETGRDQFPDSFPGSPLRNRTGTSIAPCFSSIYGRIATAENVWEVKEKENNTSSNLQPAPASRPSTWLARVSRFRRSAASRACMSTSTSPPRRSLRPGLRNRPVVL